MIAKHGIYFDNAATTPLAPAVVEAMTQCMRDEYGNASSVHGYGRSAMALVDRARAQVAALLNCHESEVYLTSGGTEADNWAIKGLAARMAHKGRHIITSPIEHHAVLHTCQALEKQGYELTYLPVDAHGQVAPDTLRAALRPDTVLVSIMMANNETGVVQPIQALAALAKANGTIFHTDAVQAVGSIPVDVAQLGVDMLSLSAHKFNGPKGVGALYIRRGLRIDNLMDGGAQERSRRGGTYNTPAIVGLGVAAQLATQGLQQKREHVGALRLYLMDALRRTVPGVVFNGEGAAEHLPGIVNAAFPYVEGESVLLSLDLAGVAVTSGSACTSGSLESSHVLGAMHVPDELSHSAVRFSLGAQNTKEEIDTCMTHLGATYQRLLSFSPLRPQQ